MADRAFKQLQPGSRVRIGGEGNALLPAGAELIITRVVADTVEFRFAPGVEVERNGERFDMSALFDGGEVSLEAFSDDSLIWALVE